MAFVAGVGLTAFGDLAPATSVDLQLEAAEQALADANLSQAEIDGLLVGYSTSAPHLMPANRFAERFGLRPAFAQGVSVGGATGLSMVDLARTLIRAGRARNVLVVAGENRRSGQSRATARQTLAEVGDPVHEVPNGGSVPAYYALLASAYLHRYGLREDDLAAFAVLMRHNASVTTGAHFRKPIAIGDVLASPAVATPLNRLDCCPISDGGAAIVLSADLPGNGPALEITGAGQAHLHQHLSATDLEDVAAGAVQAAMAAKTEAGCGTFGRIGIYDSFTITLAMLLEACGFAAPGRASAQLRDGCFERDGPLPLNTHGGLLSYGHSGVAGGMAHMVETVRQLRKDEAENSDRPRSAFLHADGGVLSAHVSLVLEARR